MINKRVEIIEDENGNRIVKIIDPLFKGRRNVRWSVVEEYLKGYIGECAEIIDTSDMVYIGSDFPDEFTHSKDTKVLRGSNLYAKANSSIAIKEMIMVASNKTYSENYKDKHKSDAKYSWYRYDTKFALPKYNNDNEIDGYNIFCARLLIRHDKDGKLYLYDILRTKKETSRPLEQ